MEALTDLFILSGAPHEKLEPLEASYRGDKKNPARAVDGWLAGLRELMREQHASEQFLGDEHWNKNSPRWKRAAATLAPYTVGRAVATGTPPRRMTSSCAATDGATTRRRRAARASDPRDAPASD